MAFGEIVSAQLLSKGQPHFRSPFVVCIEPYRYCHLSPVAHGQQLGSESESGFTD